MANRRAKFTTISPDEIEAKPGLSIPNRLKPVVSNAPREDQAKTQYLKRLVNNGTITTDDVTFLLESGALQD